MQALRRRETKINRVGVGALKVVDDVHADALAADIQFLGEQIFFRRRVGEVVARLVQDVRQVHEEQKISIAPRVKVNYQPRHDKRLAGARRHMEKHLRRFRTVRAFKVRDKIFKRLNLILARFKAQVRLNVFGHRF